MVSANERTSGKRAGATTSSGERLSWLRMTFAQRYRMIFTRLLAALLLLLLLFTDHSWKDTSLIDLLFEMTGLILIILCTFGRLWASVYVSGHKNEMVVDLGPYSIMRNPLYFFSLVGSVGLGLASENLLVLVVVTVMFAFYYPFVIKSEECYLLATLGKAYQDYMDRVPAFFPRWRNLREADNYEVNVRVFSRSLVDATMFLLLFLVMHFIEKLHGIGLLPVLFRIP